MKYLIYTKKIWSPKSSQVKLQKKFIKKSINYSEIKKINPKRIFFIHWSKFIDKKIYSNYECIQFHCSNLPKFRGGSPIQHQILNGIINTKLSAFKINKTLDTGDLCISKKISLKGSANDIYKRIEKNALDIIKKRLLKPKLSYKKQMGKPTFFKRRNEKMSKISNSVNNINKLYDFLRMLDAEDYPKAYLELKNLKVEFFNIKKKQNKIYGNFRFKKK